MNQKKPYKNKTEKEFDSGLLVNIKKRFNLQRIYRYIIKRLTKKKNHAKRF